MELVGKATTRSRCLYTTFPFRFFFLLFFFLEFRLDRDGGRDSVDLVFGPATAKVKEGPNPNPKAGVLFAFPASHTSPDHHHQAFKLKALPAFAFPCIFPS
jgi:hypothetical protein